ncbi:MAG: DNA polymerase III subunit gamma/tau, partial [Betaproteobacteria bacterium]
ALLRQMLGTVEHGHVFALIEALAGGDGRKVVELCEALRLQGLSAASTLEEMSLVLQRMAVLQVAGEGDEADPDLARLAALAQALPADETQLLYSLCLHGRAELGLAPDEYAALTMVLLRLLPFKQTGVQGGAVAPLKKPQPDSLGRSGSAPASGPPPAPTAPPAAVAGTASVQLTLSKSQDGPDSPAAPAAAAPLSKLPAPELAAPELAAPELGASWGRWVQGLLAGEHVAGLARELALQSQLVLQDGAVWTLRVEQQALQHAGACDQLLQALRALGEGAPERLQLQLGPVTDSQALRLAAAQAQRQRQAEQIIEGDPFVQDMVRQWGARIVPGSIKPWSAAAGKTV